MITKILITLLIAIGVVTMFYAWAGLGIGSDSLLIRLRMQLSLENTQEWKDAVVQFRHGFASHRWFLFYIGLMNAVIGMIICFIDMKSKKDS